MTQQAPTELINTAAAVAQYGDNGRRWLDSMFNADLLADAVVGDDHGSCSATQVVITALASGVDSVPDATESLRNLFASLDDEPAWVDHERIDRASDALIRHHAALGIALGSASLLSGASNAVAGKPMALTGRYVSQPATRSVEVADWLRHVIAPGGMRRDAEGFAYTVRVRLIHAHVRQGMRWSGKWDEQGWGVPIPQPYMAFTIAEFGHIALAAMEKLGVRYTADELDDIYHLWRYVGHVVGVDDHLNPRCATDHIRIEELYQLTSPGPSDDDRAFVAALTNDYLVPELANALPGPGQWRTASATAVVHAMQRVFIGDAAADDLHVPSPSALTLLVAQASPLLAGIGRLRIAALGGPARVTERGYRQRDREMTRMRSAYRITHQMVDDAPVTNALT